MKIGGYTPPIFLPMNSYKHLTPKQQRDMLFAGDLTKEYDPVQVISSSWLANDVFSYREGSTPAISEFKDNTFYGTPLTINFLVHDFGHMLVEVERGNYDRLKKPDFGYKSQTENGRFFFNQGQLLCELRVIAYEWILRRELLPEVFTEKYMVQRLKKKATEITWMSFSEEQEVYDYILDVFNSTPVSHLQHLWKQAVSICKQ